MRGKERSLLREMDFGQLNVAVVIPAHNESKQIVGVIDSIPQWVRGVIVVDDGSTDDTSSVVQSAASARVTLVRREENGGVGAAMKTGYARAMNEGFEIVAKVDGDGQMRCAELDRLVNPLALGIGDYAKGNRFYFRNGTQGMPGHRYFGNSALSFLNKLSSGYWHVFDPQCGFTAIRTSFLRLIDLDSIADDYFFENDMLIQLNALNAKVVDVPITTIYGQERSGVRIPRILARFPLRLLSHGMRRFWRKHLITDFSAIAGLTITGLVLAGFGALFGAFHWWESISTGDTASTGTVMLAVLPLIVGVELLIRAFSMGVVASPGSAESADYVRELIAEGTFD